MTACNCFPCFQCKYCQQGRYSQCIDLNVLGDIKRRFCGIYCGAVA
ncbi:hypothetical protein DMB90_24640 [Raoultella planticola]|uniref:Uncharacterized protein n=1 Tax=Raoultella planticola TaxID=575 RepID=A0A5P6AB37_RAOPL|nr:hypothetical protein DMB90_24640 [Raoultella planticola]